jgi:Zn-dependent protease
MNPSITLGRIAGVRIGINWSWLVVFALIVWTLATAVFPSQDPHLGKPAYVVMAFAAAVLFFSSLLLHELGHALQAKRDGVEIEGITLWLFGGVARFKGAFPSASAELRIALAGPLVSALLGSLFVVVAVVGGLGTEVDGVAAWLGYINFALLAFNMLPALPLDGGRVLRSLLWLRRGDFGSATRIAAGVGRGFGFFMVGLGLLLLIVQGVWSGVWLAFVGWFLLQAATAEGRYGLLHDALADLRVRDLMIEQPATVDGHVSLGEFMDTVAYRHHYTTYPVTDDGHVIGLLPFAFLARVPRADWETRQVLDCMLPLHAVPTVRADEPLLDAVTELGAGPVDRALVVDNELVVGLLSITDVGRLLAVEPPRARTGSGKEAKRAS